MVVDRLEPASTLQVQVRPLLSIERGRLDKYFILGMTDQQSPDDGDADNNGQEIVKPPEPMLRIGSVSVKGFNSTEFTFTVDN